MSFLNVLFVSLFFYSGDGEFYNRKRTQLNKAKSWMAAAASAPNGK